MKCLLIVPNPESALNEEAGKQLLEDYDSYASHARMMTQIHARNKLHLQEFKLEIVDPISSTDSSPRKRTLQDQSLSKKEKRRNNLKKTAELSQ